MVKMFQIKTVGPPYWIFEKLKPILEHPVFGDYWVTENCFPNFGEFTLSFVKINVAYIHVSIASK